jgi:hypothetical protein
VFETTTDNAGQLQKSSFQIIAEQGRVVVDSFVAQKTSEAMLQTQKTILSQSGKTMCNYITRECEVDASQDGKRKAPAQGDMQLIHEFSFEVVDKHASFAGVACQKMHYKMDFDIDHTVLRQNQSVEVHGCFADLGVPLLSAIPQVTIGAGFDNIKGHGASQFKEFLAAIKGLVPIEMQVSGTSGISSALNAQLQVDPRPIRSQMELTKAKPKMTDKRGRLDYSRAFVVPKDFRYVADAKETLEKPSKKF